MKDEIGCFKIASCDGEERYAAGRKITIFADDDNMTAEVKGEGPYMKTTVHSVSIFRNFINEEDVEE